MALTVSELQAVFGLDTGPFDKSLGGLKGKIGKAGVVLAGAAGVAGAAVAASLAGAIEKGRLQDKMAAQLGLGAPAAAKAGKVAGDLYKNAYGDSLEGVNGAVTAVMGSIKGMRDASAEDLKAVTANALDFATAMEVDVGAAAVSAGTLVQTGLAKNAGEAFDLLTAGAQAAGPQMVEPLLDATNEYAKHFAMLGYDGNAAMATLSSAAAGGEIAIDKAGDAVKEFGIRATDLGDTGAQESLAAIGLSGQDMANDLLAGGDRAQEATAKIAQGLLDVQDPAERAALAGGLFGTQIEDIGKENIPGFLSALTGAGEGLGNVEGAAASMGATLNDNAATNLEAFKRQASATFVDLLGGKVLPIAENVARSLATGFTPALRDLMAGFAGKGPIDGFSGSLNTLGLGLRATVMAFKDGDVTSDGFVGAMERAGVMARGLVEDIRAASSWLRDHSRTIGIVAGVIATVMLPHFVALGAAAIASGAKQAAGWAVGKAAAVKAAVVHSAQVARMVAGWVLMGAQALLQGARMAAGWVLAMGPVGWVIAAVVGLAALIITNWDTIVKYTRKAWTWVSDKVGDAWGWVSRRTGDAVQWVRDKVAAGWGWVTTKTGELRDRVLGFFTNLRDGARDRAQQMRDWVVAKATALLVAYVQFGMAVRDRVLGFFGNLRDGAVNRARQMNDWVIGAVWSLRDRALNAVRALRDRGVTLAQGLRDGIVNRVTALRDAVVGVFWNLRDGATNAFRSVRDNVTRLMDGIRGGAARPVNFLIRTVYMGGIKPVVDKIAGAVGMTTRLPEIAEIRERAHGGYTPKGMTLVGEQGPELVDFDRPGRVYTARQTRSMQSGAADGFARPERGDEQRTTVRPYQRAIARNGSLRVRDEAPGFSVAAAARQWDQLIAGLSVRSGSGSVQSVARSMNGIPGQPSSTLGYGEYGTGNISLNAARNRSAAQRKRTTMHEIGHVLGLYHPSTGSASAMKQSGSGGAMAPTAYDRASLASLYRPAEKEVGVVAKVLAKAVSSAPGQAGIKAGGWAAGNLAAMAGGALGGLLGGFPAGGVLGTILQGTGRHLIDGVLGFAKRKDDAASAAAMAPTGGGGGGGGAVAPTGNASVDQLLSWARGWQARGISVGENRALGDNPRPGSHSRTGYHYKFGNSGAVDMNAGAGESEAEKRRLTPVARDALARGFGVQWLASGHYNHLHVDVGRYRNVGNMAKYDTGGYLEPGFTMAYNGTGKRERIRTAEQEADVQRRLRDGGQGGVQMPRELVVRDVDGALVGRMKVEAGRAVTAYDKAETHSYQDNPVVY